MKRIGNLYEKIYDLDNLRLAHKNARKGKGWYKEVKMVDENPDFYLLQLQEMLKNKTYQNSTYETFVKNDKGKNREIFKLPYFPDRICQWAIIQVIEPYMLKNLTKDTYSAIPNRGIHLALNRLNKCLKDDETGTQYCFKIDINKYYPNIDQSIMMQKFSRMFKDNDLLWILDVMTRMLEHGIAIGCYLSQWEGNLYLSDLDHWVKENVGVKHYFRYMDDCVFLASTKEELHELKVKLEKYLWNTLHLTIKDNWQIYPVDSRGVDFVGYRCFRNYTLLRKSTYKNLRRKSNYIQRKLKHNEKINYHDWCSMNSYDGWLIHADCYNLKKKYIGSIRKELNQFYRQEVKSK